MSNFSKVTPENEFINSLPFGQNFTKTVNCLVIRTTEQIDTKLMHPFKKFRQNLLVTFYFVKDFNFLRNEPKKRKIFVWRLL